MASTTIGEDFSFLRDAPLGKFACTFALKRMQCLQLNWTFPLFCSCLFILNLLENKNLQDYSLFFPIL
ncbi:hypothetical protein E2320_013599 [Naja naja]|nr:hypothetical protein E2320_013599 [Naja naja]